MAVAMRRFVLLLFLAAGCATTGGRFVTPTESEIRLPVREHVVPLLTQVLNRDAWTGTVVSSEAGGTLAPAVEDGWFEDRIVIDVAARTPAGDPHQIPLADYAPVLTAFRRKLMNYVESLDAVAVDWWTVESHDERTLVFLYRHNGIRGTLRVRVRARTDDRPEEKVTRFEVTLREQ